MKDTPFGATEQYKSIVTRFENIYQDKVKALQCKVDKDNQLHIDSGISEQNISGQNAITTVNDMQKAVLFGQIRLKWRALCEQLHDLQQSQSGNLSVFRHCYTVKQLLSVQSQCASFPSTATPIPKVFAPELDASPDFQSLVKTENVENDEKMKMFVTNILVTNYKFFK